MGEVFKEKLTLLTWLFHFKDEKRGFGKDSVAGCMIKKGMLLFWVLAAVIIWEGHNPPGLW